MNEKEIVSNTGKTRQWLAAIIVNFSTISYGMSLGWPSPVIQQLRNIHPPVGHTKLTDEQISWISGLLPIGALLIVPFSGSLSEKFGRKGFAYLAGIPLIASWLLKLFGTSHVYILYMARFIAGMGASMGMFIAPLYVSEIASEDIRGSLNSLVLLSAKIGILGAYIAGTNLSYRMFAAVALIMPISFVVAFFFMPETPVYLVRRNRLMQAEKSLMFFKGNNRELARQELARLKSQVNESNNSTKKMNFSYIFHDRATSKGLIISLGLIAGQQFSGILAMINYAEPIFKLSNSSLMSAKTSTILIAVIQVISSYLSTLLMERAGRRLLSLISCVGMTICHCLIGTFFCLSDSGYDVNSISWLPIVALSSFMITYCLGMGQMPFVVTAEVFRNDVASFASTVCYVSLWVMAFVVIKTFGIAIKLLGGVCFFIFAGFCIACFVFCYYWLPETKGRKREDIVAELAGIIAPKNGEELADEEKDLMTTKSPV